MKNTCTVRVLWLSVLVGIVGCVIPPAVSAAGKPVEQTIVEFGEKFPYRAFDVRDKFDRSIRFYLTDADARDDKPLIVVLQGSGCSSNFFLNDGRVNQSWHALVRRAAGTRAQVLVVEKPGVKLFDRPANPGGAKDCSPEFRREQTGPRWLTAIEAAVEAVTTLRGKAPRATMALGHSEGAVFAPRLAISTPSITHGASLAAVPVSQLHSFFDMAAAGEGFIAKAPGDKADHMRRVLDAWKQVNADPDSETREVFGHPHRYWVDKFQPFDYAALAGSKAKFFIAQGDADANSAPRISDAFALELLTRKRDLTWLRIPGADHGFTLPGQASGAGMSGVITQAVAWFLGDSFDMQHVIWPLPAS